MKPARTERKAEAHLSGHGHRISRIPLRWVSFSRFLGNLEFNVQAACSAAHVCTHINWTWFLLRVLRSHGMVLQGAPLSPDLLRGILRKHEGECQAWTLRTHPGGTAPATPPWAGSVVGSVPPALSLLGPASDGTEAGQEVGWGWRQAVLVVG